MIYYSKELIRTWQPNLMLLDLEDDLGHIYVSRNTYDQAVLIADRFNYDVDAVDSKLGGIKDQEDSVSYMSGILPSPINVLSPFYNTITKEVKLDVDNLEQIIGVLSYLSMSFDFNMMLKVPFEVRCNLTFTKSILLNYQSHYEDFNITLQKDSNQYYSSGLRKEQVDFKLEEEEEDTEEADMLAFLDEIGMNDIPTFNEVLNSDKVSVKEEVEEELSDKQKERLAYDAVISNYAG